MESTAANTITLAELVEVMRGEVVDEERGRGSGDRYAPDDPSWSVPAGSLPEGLEGDEPLEFGEAITDVDELTDDD